MTHVQARSYPMDAQIQQSIQTVMRLTTLCIAAASEAQCTSQSELGLTVHLFQSPCTIRQIPHTSGVDCSKTRPASSSEAEYMTLAAAVKKAIWLSRIITFTNSIASLILVNIFAVNQ
eukprot:IDg11011t1